MLHDGQYSVLENLENDQILPVVILILFFGVVEDRPQVRAVPLVEVGMQMVETVEWYVGGLTLPIYLTKLGKLELGNAAPIIKLGTPTYLNRPP